MPDTVSGSEAAELQEEMDQWRQRMRTLKENENYEDKVTNTTDRFLNLYP